MRYLIRQKYFSIRDGFYITDEHERNAYYVQGKFFSLAKQLTIYDLQGRELLFIKQKLFHILPNYDIFEGENLVATVKRKFSIFTKHYNIESSIYGDMRIEGNIFAWNFSIISKEGREIARISKKVLNIRDTYTVDIFDKNFEALSLAITLIIDAVHHISR